MPLAVGPATEVDAGPVHHHLLGGRAELHDAPGEKLADREQQSGLAKGASVDPRPTSGNVLRRVGTAEGHHQCSIEGAQPTEAERVRRVHSEGAVAHIVGPHRQEPRGASQLVQRPRAVPEAGGIQGAQEEPALTRDARR